MSKEDAVTAARSGLEHGHFFCETPVTVVGSDDTGEATSGADWIVRGLLAEREAALKAYAALWKLLDEMADEERGIHDIEASWLYTEQPAEVWAALRADGLAPTRCSEPSR